MKFQNEIIKKKQSVLENTQFKLQQASELKEILIANWKLRLNLHLLKKYKEKLSKNACTLTKRKKNLQEA